MNKGVAVALVGLLTLAACGGSDAGSDAGDSLAPPTTELAPTRDDGENVSATAPGGDEVGETPDDEDAAAPTGLGSASVTLDGKTYQFGETNFPALRCDPDLFGVFWVLLGQVDESGDEVPNGGSLQIVLLHHDTDESEVGRAPEAILELTDVDQRWIADPEALEQYELEPASSQIDDYTIDGNSASGTATFYESNSYFAVQGGISDETLVSQGTFEATCAG